MLQINEAVKSPSISINKARTIVYITGETISLEHPEGTGTSHTLSMSMMDAMRLLGLLKHLQERFQLPQIVSEPIHVDVPPDEEMN